ncbi:MAG: hypothetical protein V4613_02885 [Bacteroidota bacterium]
MKSTIITIYIFLAAMFIACQPGNSVKTNKAKEYLLDSIFPTESIVSVTVTNFNGTHKLTTNELITFKEQLKQAKYAGGLLIKPGHITLTIHLKANSVAKPGFVYASTGSIHFEGGVDQFNNHFTGTFYLPTKLNFDNYMLDK